MEKRGNRICETAETRVRTPLKLSVYFWFVSEAIGGEPTIFPSCMLNFVNTNKEMHM